MRVEKKLRLDNEISSYYASSGRLTAILASCAVFAQAEPTEPVRWQLNMTPGVTQTAANAYHAHMIMLWICVVIGVIVFGAMAYAMFKFRKSKGAKPDTDFTHSTKLELIWTIVPILILVGSAWPATQHGDGPVRCRPQRRNGRDDHQGHRLPVDVALRIRRRGRRLHQPPRPRIRPICARARPPARPSSAAHAHYLRDVDKPLVLPADTRIRFVITADDVIHAWWVPALGWKQDAIPGHHQRSLDQGHQTRHLPRPVRRAVRQGPRLHADRGEGAAEGRIPDLAGSQKAARRLLGRHRRLPPKLPLLPRPLRRRAAEAPAACSARSRRQRLDRIHELLEIASTSRRPS